MSISSACRRAAAISACASSSGWREVADHALAFVRRCVRA
jgi:hypothetical protein